jgi:hypothetical protein
MSNLTADERMRLLKTAWDLDARLYPENADDAPTGRAASLIRESYYSILGEYADRLPRVRMSTCPFTNLPFEHTFDPWGFDGPWWLQDREISFDEPGAPASFKVLLGAAGLHGRTPQEAREPVRSGPEVPFVVPRLLGLPGMVAVISQLEMTTGDTAYPIVYFSQEEIPPSRLHQFWRDQDLWFTTAEGQSAWTIANDVWDFELEPWIAQGRLKWIRPGDPKFRVVDSASGDTCPFLNLPGERAPNIIAGGERHPMALPDGRAINPFED